jgi:hypothetical protein
MKGRFRSMGFGNGDSLPLEHASRNPYYREYPPGVANERVEMPVVLGMVDFVLYVLAIYPLASAYQACFFLWALPIPLGFLSAVMPVGPASAWYWRRTHPRQRTARLESLEEIERGLIARRQRMQELEAETVSVEAELTRELPKAGDLHFAFEVQIRQARQARERVHAEIVRIDIELAKLRML